MSAETKGTANMKNYSLESDEVLLFRCEVVQDDASEETVELVLTNLHIVFIGENENAPLSEKVSVTKYPVTDIKMYNGLPQIKQNNRNVELFLSQGEKTIEFKTRMEANRFIDVSFELLTGKTKLARGASKIKKSIDDVNEALGVDVIDEVKNFSVDTVTRIINNTKPSSLFSLFKKKKK